MKELLFLTHRIPYPPNKGDKVRSFNLLKHLARDYRVHLGTFIDDPRDWRHVDAVKAMCGETCFVRLHPAWAKFRSLGALARGEPLTLPYYCSRRLRNWVARLLNGGAVNRVLVFSSAMAQYVEEETPGGMRYVLDFVDMDSDKWRQYSDRHRWPMNWLYRRESAALFAFERHQARRFDASFFVSEAEAALFRKQAPETAARVTYIENGVDTDFFSPARDYPNPYPPEQRALVFTGAMDYWANVDAVTWFVREVLPRIREQDSAAHFYIVGARPTDEVRKLAEQPGVDVTGAVVDIRPYMAHAQVAVAPLRIARGIQNKVLEAMAMARPVLATPQAMDGIRSCPGLEWGVAESPVEITQRVLELLHHGDSLGLGRLGRECVQRHYSWAENLKHIEHLLEGDIVSMRRMSR